MSAQHEQELRESGLHARIFASDAGSDLFPTVEIIDLNKLAERKGVKRVAVRDFGENNLVLVDEGHLGASGNVWRERRAELARGGFAFEYSATFNQIAGRDEALRDAYGIGRVLADAGATRAMLDRLLTGRSGLTDDAGED